MRSPAGGVVVFAGGRRDRGTAAAAIAVASFSFFFLFSSFSSSSFVFFLSSVALIRSSCCHGDRGSAITSLKDQDVRACNTTSSGAIYSDGHYAPMMLRSVSLPVGAPSLCFYRFTGTDHQRIWLQVQQLAVGRYDFRSRSCRDGVLRIFDGRPDPGSYMYPPFRFCGQYEDMNATVFTSGHVAVVELHSQSDRVSAHVTIAFKYVNIDSEADNFPRQITHSMRLVQSTAYICMWRITIEDCDGECLLLSPGYPGAYPPNTECGYHVDSSHDPHKVLQLRFSGLNGHTKPREFNVRRTEDCREDHFEIYDGDSTTSPKIGRFCGNSIPDVTSSGSHLYVLFVTGPDTPRYGYVGFHASILGLTKEWPGGGVKAADRLCDWSFNVSEGSASTPDHWLPKGIKCTYVIHIAPRHHLHVVLNVYGLGASCEDYIEIYEDHRFVRRLCESMTYDQMRRNEEGQRHLSAAADANDDDDDDDDDDDVGVLRFQFSNSPVRFIYYSSSGQMQSSPERGFWYSYKLIPEADADGSSPSVLTEGRGEKGGGGGGGGGGEGAKKKSWPPKVDPRPLSDHRPSPDYHISTDAVSSAAAALVPALAPAASLLTPPSVVELPLLVMVVVVASAWTRSR